MPIVIQRITIEDEKIELIVADDANSEAATTWLQLRVPCKAERSRPLAELLLTALQTARSALNAEIAPVPVVNQIRTYW